MYDQGPFFASLAYELQQGSGLRPLTNAVTTSNSASLYPATTQADSYQDKKVAAWKVGVAWKPTFGQIGVIYEKINDDVDNSPLSRDAWYVNGMYKFGGDTGVISSQFDDVSFVPEPSALLLLVLGFALVRRR